MAQNSTESALQPPAHFFYTNESYPKLTRYPLHTAVYNGRERQVLALLDAETPPQNAQNCLYQLASDLADQQSSSALFIALARRHRTIADRLLAVCARDLAAIEQHFTGLGIRTRFWLRERILIAFGADHIELVRQATVAQPPILADAAAMAAHGHRGLIVLLKPSNRTEAGVVWLSARQPGADRAIARLVGAIYERGGELAGPWRREHFECNAFDVAARMALPEQWLRMFEMFGGAERMARREAVRQCRRMAEVEASAPTEELGGRRFDELCQRMGGFEAADLFASAEQDGESVFYLYDAIVEWSKPNAADDADVKADDVAMFDHLMRLATGDGRRSATQVIDQRVVHDGVKRTLFEVALLVSYGPNGLPSKLLRYRPTLLATSSPPEAEWWDTALHRLISQTPWRPDAHALIVEQLPEFSSAGQFGQDLVQTLSGYGWTDTLRALFEHDPAYKRFLCARDEYYSSCLRQLATNGLWSHLTWLLGENGDAAFDDEQMMLDLFVAIVDRPGVEIPEGLWRLLVRDVDVRSVRYADMMAACLKGMNLRYYRKLEELMRLTAVDEVQMNAIITSTGENLLFASLWNRVRTKIPTFTHPPATESPEIVDTEDTTTSATHKLAVNRQRQPASLDYRYTYEADAALERQYAALFAELLAAGVDVHRINAAGCNLVHRAVRHNNADALRRLLAAGVNPSLPDATRSVPMHLVRSTEVFDLLPAADVRCVNNDGETILISYPYEVPYYEQDHSMLERFIAAGAPVRQVGAYGDTALHRCLTGRIARLLLAAGADVNAPNEQGDTPAHCAMNMPADAERRELLAVLMAHPEFDVMRCNKSGVSLFAWVAQMGEADFAALRPLIGEERLVELMEKHCTSPTNERSSLLAYTQQSDENLWCLRALLEAPDLCVDPAKFQEPIGIAADQGRWLLECGAHVSERTDKRPLDWSGVEAVMWATKTEVLPKPTTQEADDDDDDVNGSDSSSQLLRQYLAQLDMFVAAGCNTEVRNLVGETALQCYCREGDGTMTRALVLCRLLAAGADYRLLTTDRMYAVGGGGRALEDTVFRSFYEWDGERGEGILHQVFQPRMDFY